MAQETPSSLEKGLVVAAPPDPPDQAEGVIVVEKHRITDQVDNLADVEASRGWFASLLRYARVLRVEERGIERVKEEDRVKQSTLDGFTMWASANFTYGFSFFFFFFLVSPF